MKTTGRLAVIQEVKTTTTQLARVPIGALSGLYRALPGVDRGHRQIIIPIGACPGWTGDVILGGQGHYRDWGINYLGAFIVAGG